MIYCLGVLVVPPPPLPFKKETERHIVLILLIICSAKYFTKAKEGFLFERVIYYISLHFVETFVYIIHYILSSFLKDFDYSSIKWKDETTSTLMIMYHSPCRWCGFAVEKLSLVKNIQPLKKLSSSRKK